MANETPQIQDSQPILNNVNVNSGAEGYESFAKTLGSLASTAEAKTEELVGEQSQTMYINSVADIEHLKTKAQEDMLKEPGNASKVAEHTNAAFDKIKQNAFVNSGDRTKLNSYIKGATDDVGLSAVKTEVEQRKLEAGFTHFAAFPDQLKAYQQALLTDHDKAETLKSAMISSLHGLVTTGAITPSQAGSSIKSMSDLVSGAEDMHRLYGNPNATAKDIHSATANPLTNGSSAAVGSPVNESTAWGIDYYNGDKSLQGVMSSLNNDMLPNPESFLSLTPHQRQEVMLQAQGHKIAKGLINSNEGFPAIENHYKSLSEKNRILSNEEKGFKNGLGRYIDGLKNGEFLDVMGRTAAGNTIMNDYNARNSAINTTYAYSPEGKQQALMENQDRMVNGMVALGHATHTPSEYIQPIPKTDVATAQSGFQAGSNPVNVLNVIGKYSKQNQGYLANSMKDPEQRMIVLGASLSGTNVATQDKLDFITANQSGMPESQKSSRDLSKEIDGATTDKTLMTRIYSNLKEPIGFVNHNYDQNQAIALQDAMLKTTLKTAHYLAQKNGDLGMTGDWKKYVDQASKFYTSSLQQKSGTNWVVNPNQMEHPLSNPELDIIADYAIANGNDYLHNSLGAERYNQMRGRGALKMIMTPTNDVQAVTPQGEVAFSIPYTTNLVHHAKEEMRKRQPVVEPEGVTKQFGRLFSPPMPHYEEIKF